jgi:hypothetical protein
MVGRASRPNRRDFVTCSKETNGHQGKARNAYAWRGGGSATSSPPTDGVTAGRCDRTSSQRFSRQAGRFKATQPKPHRARRLCRPWQTASHRRRRLHPPPIIRSGQKGNITRRGSSGFVGIDTRRYRSAYVVRVGCLGRERIRVARQTTAESQPEQRTGSHGVVIKRDADLASDANVAGARCPQNAAFTCRRLFRRRAKLAFGVALQGDQRR